MVIADTRSFPVGRFTVWQKPRMDNPGFAQYLVFLGSNLIGKQFSVPDLAACRWLETHQDGLYASSSHKLKRWSDGR